MKDSLGVYFGKSWRGYKKIKERLVKSFGMCYWCKNKVKIYNEQAVKGVKRPDDEATLDHLKSRNVGRKKGEVTPKVLSCRKCNEERAKQEVIKNLTP